MTRVRRTQADRSAATRAALIAAGRRLFAERGFAGVGTAAIVDEAEVSRGALYHHFGDKTELFAAALAEVEGEIAQRLATEALAGSDGDFVTLMIQALQSWLDACERSEVRRIVLIDGPSVLGWRRWRDICQRHVLGLIADVLTRGMADGAVTPLPIEPLAHILLAAAEEAALYVGASEAPDAARRDMVAAMRPLIEALTRS